MWNNNTDNNYTKIHDIRNINNKVHPITYTYIIFDKDYLSYDDELADLNILE